MDLNIEDYSSNFIAAAKEGLNNAFTGNDLVEAPRFGAAVLTVKGNIYAA